MKNFLVVAVTIALVYLIWDALQPVPPPPAPVLAVATPAPTAPPKVYFHSSLDAPAMSTSEHTAMGYFSADRESQFNGGYSRSGYGSSGVYSGGGPTVVMVPTGQQNSTGTARTAMSGVMAGTAQANRMMAQRMSTNRAATVPTRTQMPTPVPVRAW